MNDVLNVAHSNLKEFHTNTLKMIGVLYIAHSNLKEFHSKHAVNEWRFIQNTPKFK